MKTFHLPPLTSAETDELITALDPTLTADERTKVRHRCDGVPLFIEEIVTKLHEQPTDGARWARVPDALYEPLFARLRTSDVTIQVVEAAATIGREFDRDILRSASDMTAADFDAAIHDLENALVFEPTGTDSWRFRHQLLREVAYDTRRRVCSAFCTVGWPMPSSAIRSIQTGMWRHSITSRRSDSMMLRTRISRQPTTPAVAARWTNPVSA